MASRIQLNDKRPGLSSQFSPPAWMPLWSPEFSEHRRGEALRNHRAVTKKCLWVWGQESEERPASGGDWQETLPGLETGIWGQGRGEVQLG